MKCPKCGSLLESSTGEERVFKLQYGKRYEPAYTCTGGCPGLWTETSIGLYQEMIQRGQKRARRIPEEQPTPEEH